MRQDVLHALLHARSNRSAVILITSLETGEQALLSGDRTVAGTPPAISLTEKAAEALQTDRCLNHLFDGQEYFIQPFNPPLRLMITGAVHIAQTLAVMARMCGYEVIVIDPRQAFASSHRFPDTILVTEWPEAALQQLPPDHRTAMVCLAHDPKLDDPALVGALQTRVFYIGALGSRRTRQARDQRLAELGFPERDLNRIHGPVGLDIGARSPAEIAVSIMAEITQTLHQRKPA